MTCSMHIFVRLIIALFSFTSALLFVYPQFRDSHHLRTPILSKLPFSFEQNQSHHFLQSLRPRHTIVRSPLPSIPLPVGTISPSEKLLCSLPTTLPPLRTPPADLPSFLNSYIRTHARNRAKIAADRSIITSPNGPPLLVWRCHSRGGRRCAGLGDRMRGIRLAFLLAVVTNRTFFIDWPANPHPLQIALIPSHIDWTLPQSLQAALPPEKSPLLTASYAHLHWWHRVSADRILLPTNKSLNLGIDDVQATLGALPPLLMLSTLIGNAFNRVIFRNPHIPHEFRLKPQDNLGQFNFAKTNMLTRLLFVPSPTTTALLSRRLGFSHKSYVALHLRTGVDVGEHSIDRFKNMNAENPMQIVHMLLRCAKLVANGTDAYGQFALATDSAIHANIFQNLGEKQGLKTSVPMRPAFHIAQRMSRRPLEESRRLKDGCRDFLDVFVDLCLLAGSDVLIASNSGFSNAAIFMGSTQRVGVFNYVAGGRSVCEMN